MNKHYFIAPYNLAMETLPPSPQPIIFTDLDGTLLELESYAYTPVAPLVAQVTTHNIPIIFCSSKTAAEQVIYRHVLGLNTPFIVENGAAIFIPETYFSFEFSYHRLATYLKQQFKVIELGINVVTIRQILAHLRTELGLSFHSYVDLTLAEISQLTGLDSAAAQQASQRDYSETILQWYLTPAYNSIESMQHYLSQHLTQYECQGIKGSQFYTVSSIKGDKGIAVQLLSHLYRCQYKQILTLGIGDGLNDAPMFTAVDQAFLVQKPNQTWADISLPHLIKIEAIGPKGWAQIIQPLVKS